MLAAREGLSLQVRKLLTMGLLAIEEGVMLEVESVVMEITFPGQAQA